MCNNCWSGTARGGGQATSAASAAALLGRPSLQIPALWPSFCVLNTLPCPPAPCPPLPYPRPASRVARQPPPPHPPALPPDFRPSPDRPDPRTPIASMSGPGVPFLARIPQLDALVPERQRMELATFLAIGDLNLQRSGSAAVAQRVRGGGGTRGRVALAQERAGQGCMAWGVAATRASAPGHVHMCEAACPTPQQTRMSLAPPTPPPHPLVHLCSRS